jgi:hypothetical protein
LDHHPNYWGKKSSHVPNHQPVEDWWPLIVHYGNGKTKKILDIAIFDDGVSKITDRKIFWR